MWYYEGHYDFSSMIMNWLWIFEDEDCRRLWVQPRWIQNPNNANFQIILVISKTFFKQEATLKASLYKTIPSKSDHKYIIIQSWQNVVLDSTMVLSFYYWPFWVPNFSIFHRKARVNISEGTILGVATLGHGHHWHLQWHQWQLCYNPPPLPLDPLHRVNANGMRLPNPRHLKSSSLHIAQTISSLQTPWFLPSFRRAIKSYLIFLEFVIIVRRKKQKQAETIEIANRGQRWGCWPDNHPLCQARISLRCSNHYSSLLLTHIVATPLEATMVVWRRWRCNARGETAASYKSAGWNWHSAGRAWMS